MCRRFVGGLVLVLALIPGVAPAQPAVVEGQVRDAQGAPVPYANVQIDGAAVGTAAGANGRFRFETTRTGSVVLRASARSVSRTVLVSPARRRRDRSTGV